MPRWIREFREFAVKGNVVDLAVGLIIGGAFSKIVDSLVKDVMMPPIGYVLDKVDFSTMRFVLIKADDPTTAIASAVGTAATAIPPDEVAIWYGRFINNVIHFVIVAFAVYLLVKQINRLKRQPAAASPTTRECPRCISAIPLNATRCPHCTSEIDPLPV